MKILHNNIEILNIQVDDSSYRYRAIKGDHNLTLYFSLAEHVEIPVGAYCVYENETYTLEKPESLTMKHSRYFEYTVVFDSPQAKAGKWKFRNPVDRRLKFPLTAKPIEHLQMFVDNMNQRDSGWTIGRCIDAPEKTISYNHAYCIDALSQMADEWETEYEFVGKQVSLWKVEYNRDNPLPLSYGKGNGFKPGIGRSNYEDSTPIEILYIQGGEQNIDASQYGSSELLLPKSQTIRFDGEHFEGEQGFDSSKARTYQTDADGFSIRRADKPLSSQAEDSLDCSEIYPSRVGTISAVTVVDASKHFYDIVDSSIPASLNFEDCLIEGETLTIIPQTGMLAGKEFEAKYIHNAKEGKAARRFEIVPQDIDGQTMPGGNYIPQVGDTYAVFHCMLPAAYICDNATKTGASWDMFRQGVKYLYDNEEQKFTFTGELDGIWAKKDWLNIGGMIKLGGFVQFSDERFQPEGVLVRIIGIKDYINNPHSPEIELSNSTVGRTVSSDLRKIESNEVVMDTLHKEALQFTKRRYRDSMETIEMLGDALLDNFSNSINPIAVKTMAMLIGDKSLQFEFVNSMTNPSPVVHNVTYNQATKVLSVPAGIIQHYTLGIDTISSSHAADEYKFWSLPAFTTPTLTDGTKKYYLYAKVSKTAKTGTFYISEQAIAMEGVAGYYHLLMGVLNSEYDGERSYVSLYGFTEVLPGQVITNKVASANGKNFMDFLNNAFRIGNDKTYIDWNASVANVLSMKNATIQIANTAGQTMIYFSGVDGSGQLAKGNITWDSAGNIKANGGTFTDILIQGSLRSPFVRETDSIVIGKQSTHDNVVPIASGGGWVTVGTLEWGVEQSGRRMCIANYRWGSEITTGSIEYSAPSGKYFYEDGTQKKAISLSRECVELMGYGTSTQFYGWIVLNRINLMTTSKYGRKLNVLAQGIVTGYSSGASISYKSYDNASTLSVSRQGTGKYRVNFPSNWGLITGSYIVMMTGYGSGLMKATLLEAGTSYFIAEVSNDSSANDGSFMFQIINLNDWLVL
ncbi:hypothetical protein [Alistipes ihumii]|uniref:Uncharacterized protein n=1 Tax=Alistipes ihumii AP11 TaxID=1211813 RepID=A0ABY5V3K2_9BACT|nr:hypothetical protein [Alistipes ihumii]UWN58021.1 hypothetical protein NQ491_04385 [Alistipes ihumii AP11]